MKKILFITALFLTQAVNANPDKYLSEGLTDNESGRQLRTFVRQVIKIEQEQPGILDGTDSKSNPGPRIRYERERSSALSDDVLNPTSLQTKYNCIKAIFKFRKEEKSIICEPVHVAQRIVDSFPTTSEAEPEVILAIMKSLVKLPDLDTNLLLTTWSAYVMQQARNTSLQNDLREQFAKFYAKIYSTDESKRFSYRLLSEIK